MGSQKSSQNSSWQGLDTGVSEKCKVIVDEKKPYLSSSFKTHEKERLKERR